MTTYIVTVKLHQKGHDPRNKQLGECITSDFCTDRTGAHHCLLVEANSIDEVLERVKFNHITRIEVAKWMK